MSRAMYHEYPACFQFKTTVIQSRPGAVKLARSAMYPAGGGQPSDRGSIAWDGGSAIILRVEREPDGIWHYIEDERLLEGEVLVAIDRDFRSVASQLHTDLHILNALIFKRFEGALVTGAQIGLDGTARMDFALAGVDKSALAAIEAEVNDVIRQGLTVREHYLTRDEVANKTGLVRTRDTAPPTTADDVVRVVEIVGLDRQACGGTHLARTDESRFVRFLKIDNKGRDNRRIRIGLILE